MTSTFIEIHVEALASPDMRFLSGLFIISGSEVSKHGHGRKTGHKGFQK